MARQISVFLIAITVFFRIIYLYAPIRGEDDAKANRRVLNYMDGMLFLSALGLLYTYYAEWSDL